MSPGSTTLGTHMKRRRAELGISQSEAARRATDLRHRLAATASDDQRGVGRSTWINWENDRFVPEDFNFALIEGVLRWRPGSVAAVLDGGEPTPLPPDANVVPIAAGLPPDDAFVRKLRGRKLTPEYLDVLIREYWAEKAREQERIQDKYLRMASAAEG